MVFFYRKITEITKRHDARACREKLIYLHTEKKERRKKMFLMMKYLNILKGETKALRKHPIFDENLCQKEKY